MRKSIAKNLERLDEALRDLRSELQRERDDERTCHMVFNNPLADDNCKCDSCGCTFDLLRGVGWISGRYDYLWSYCANCGAEVVDDE